MKRRIDRASRITVAATRWTRRASYLRVLPRGSTRAGGRGVYSRKWHQVDDVVPGPRRRRRDRPGAHSRARARPRARPPARSEAGPTARGRRPRDARRGAASRARRAVGPRRAWARRAVVPRRGAARAVARAAARRRPRGEPSERRDGRGGNGRATDLKPASVLVRRGASRARSRTRRRRPRATFAPPGGDIGFGFDATRRDATRLDAHAPPSRPLHPSRARAPRRASRRTTRTSSSSTTTRRPSASFVSPSSTSARCSCARPRSPPPPRG